MWDRKQLKEQGKLNFKKNYWPCVLVAAILEILLAAETKISKGSSGTTESLQQLSQQTGISSGALIAALIGGVSILLVLAVLIEIFVRNMFIVGGIRFFINNGRTEKGDLHDLVSVYSEGRFLKVFLTMFLRDLFLILWTCLFIIPGIIKSYSYRMVPYILADHPEVDATEAISMSRRMMDGNKWDTFVLDLSFIGWSILTVITCGLVGIFYYFPYKQSTDAALYEAIKDNYTEA